MVAKQNHVLINVVHSTAVPIAKEVQVTLVLIDACCTPVSLVKSGRLLTVDNSWQRPLPSSVDNRPTTVAASPPVLTLSVIKLVREKSDATKMTCAET